MQRYGRRRGGGRRTRAGVCIALLVALAGIGLARLVSGNDAGHAAVAGLQRSSATGAPTTATAGSSAPNSAAVPKAPRGRPLPILMYHVVEAPPAGAPYPELYVPGPVFAAQVRYLAGHDFHAVTLQQVWRYWTRGAQLPVHPVVLSF